MKAPPVDLGALTEALRAEPRAARELAGILLGALASAAAQQTEYSSRRGCGPAGYAPRAWRELAREIGVRRGRWFIVTAEALAAHERQRSTATAEPSTATYPVDEAWTPARAVAAAGLRLVGVAK